MAIRAPDGANKIKLTLSLAFTTGLSKGLLLECIDAGFREDGKWCCVFHHPDNREITRIHLLE